MGHIGHCGLDPAVAELNRYMAGNDHAAAAESDDEILVSEYAEGIVHHNTKYRTDDGGNISFSDLAEWVDGDALDASMKKVLRGCSYVELVEARAALTEVMMDAAKGMASFYRKNIVIDSDVPDNDEGF